MFWQEKLLLFPATTVAMFRIYSGTVSIPNPNLRISFFTLRATVIQSPSFVCLLWPIKESNLWIWAYLLQSWKILLCTIVPCSPQWQETQLHCTKTLFWPILTRCFHNVIHFSHKIFLKIFLTKYQLCCCISWLSFCQLPNAMNRYL